ncbi:hypothetical protein PENNAL_c0001G09902 [Penicillium nalgiovense]|uniref:F5/8 type C domain-containing protein n=1 Tax=Penicillium nalgiovense TaxID=60175 RepID=A0A1V6ZAL4_PENNA|nr:hypothetical protein PENNAL_c0001G09902 [Penicillium nalgiovense]
MTIDMDRSRHNVDVPTYGAIDPEKYCWQAKPRGGSRLDRTNFSVECSSQENDDNKCENMLDGQVHTYWRSKSSTESQNNSIIIDLGSEQKVNGLSMLPLMDKDARGQFAKHEVYLSSAKRDWKRVAYGLWGWNKSVKLAVFEPEVAKYVKLVAKGEAPLSKSPDTKYQETWTSIVDIAIYALWSAWADNQFFASPGGETFTITWDPIREDVYQASVANNEHDMFCPGISMDFDGRIIVSGGVDSDKTSIFNGTGWERGESMVLHRGYHSTTTLSDGRIFAIGGSWSGGPNNPKDGEIYNPWTRTWKRLYNLQREIIETDDRPLRADNHAWLFGWKNGSVFHAGPSYKMHWFNTRTKGGSYVSAGYRLDDQHSMSGNNVMFDAIRGQERYDGSFGTRNAHFITINEPYKKPKVQVAGLNGTKSENNPGGMFYQRVFHASVVLPDGSVFIADIFVPLQGNNFVRVYHSLSILLPDATVLNGGGGLCGNCTVNHYDAQIFRPPYLYNKDGTPATQPKTPSVENRSSKVIVGKTLRFFADADIKSASLVRLGTVSHTVNTDQRRVPLDYTCVDSEDGYKYCKAQIYPDPGVALPGYYMLFVMNSAGVPSKAATIKVELDFPLSHFTEEEEEEAEHKKDCDMNVASGKQVQGMVDMIFAAARKFWNPPQSTLVTQG